MANDKLKHLITDQNDDNEIDTLILKVLMQNGYLFPDSDGELELVIKEVENNPIDIPQKLLDPVALIDKAYERELESSNNPTYSNNLAQAAREGGSLNETVKKIMQSDKLNAKNLKLKK